MLSNFTVLNQITRTSKYSLRFLKKYFQTFSPLSCTCSLTAGLGSDFIELTSASFFVPAVLKTHCILFFNIFLVESGGPL